MKFRISLTALLALFLMAATLLVRLIALGRVPLTPSEAASALEAAQLVGLSSPFWGEQGAGLAPGYQSLTGTLMVWFGAHNFISRLIPALFGAALAALPLAINRELSWPAKLLAALFLAFSAASLTASRTAGSLTMAAFGLSLALLQSVRADANERSTSYWVIGLGLGIALAAGTHLWQGLFGVALAGVLAMLIPASAESAENPTSSPLTAALQWQTGISALVAAVLLSTGFGVHVEGLAGMLQAPGHWLLGWAGAGGWPLLTALAIPFVYEPLLIVIGAFGVFRALSKGAWLERSTALWACGGLLAYLLYPSRQPGDLLWAVIPLALLAAIQVEWIADQLLDLASPISSIMLALVLLTVLSFAYLMLESSVAGFGLASLDKQGQLAFAVTALAFALMLILLFGIGWSWRETLLALAISAVLCFGMLSFASAWSLNFTEAVTEGRELWRRRVTTLHMPLLENTLADIAKWEVGRADGLDLEVQGQAPASLAWALRPHQPAEVGGAGVAPPVILAPETASPRLPADYLGQAFAISENWGWQRGLPPNLLSWLLDRQAPVEVERWILYVRTDVAELGLTPALPEAE